jgi:hypothetical protein
LNLEPYGDSTDIVPQESHQTSDQIQEANNQNQDPISAEPTSDMHQGYQNLNSREPPLYQHTQNTPDLRRSSRPKKLPSRFESFKLNLPGRMWQIFIEISAKNLK